MFSATEGIIYAASSGATPTLSVSVEITNQKAVNRLLQNLRQFMKLDGKKITIHLEHKGGTKPLSMFKNVDTSETDISRILSIADRVVSPWYRSPNPGVGEPFPERVDAVKPAMDMTVRKTIQKAFSKKKGLAHNRKSYMDAVRSQMMPIFKSNDLYQSYVKMITN